MQTVICILGPTASGKTSLSIELAKEIGGEIVSCDSMQVYQEMQIGTAQPTIAEQQGIRHHLLSVVPPTVTYSAAAYVAQADRAIAAIAARGHVPVICGGTGLYLEALLQGLHTAVGSQDSALRRELYQVIAAEGLGRLFQELQTVDPVASTTIHPNDERRIVRALEVYRETGRPLSEHHAISKAQPPRYRALLLGLRFLDRQALHARIEQRVDEMIAAGLLAEVAALLKRQPPPCPTALQAIGYKEFAPYLRGEEPLETAVALLKQSTRQLAKRQMTWFTRMSQVQWLEGGNAHNFERATQIVHNFGFHNI